MVYGSCDLYPARVGLAGYRMQGSGDLACGNACEDLSLLHRELVK
jgi:hypothetical protein